MRSFTAPISIVLGLLVITLTAACTSAPTPTSSSSSSSGSTVTSAKFADDVMPIILTQCALSACHGSKESHLGILLTADKAQVYAELQKSSPTEGFNGAKFVVPGKPDQSFFMAKIDGTQAKFPGCSGGCGNRMPQEESLAKIDRDIIRKWISNGAKDD